MRSTVPRIPTVLHGHPINISAPTHPPYKQVHSFFPTIQQSCPSPTIQQSNKGGPRKMSPSLNWQVFLRFASPMIAKAVLDKCNEALTGCQLTLNALLFRSLRFFQSVAVQHSKSLTCVSNMCPRHASRPLLISPTFQVINNTRFMG